MTRTFGFCEPLKLFKIPLMIENQRVTLFKKKVQYFQNGFSIKSLPEVSNREDFPHLERRYWKYPEHASGGVAILDRQIGIYNRLDETFS